MPQGYSGEESASTKLNSLIAMQGIGGSPVKESELSRELSKANAYTGDLLRLVQELHDKLSPVLHMAPPSEANQKSQEPQTGVGKAVSEITARVDSANYILRSILSRLEI